MSIQEVNLKAIANAIREKDYTKEPIAAISFADRISAIKVLPEGTKTITLESDPPEAGIVKGGGVASDGMVISLSAEPVNADDFEFSGWEENGEIVTKEPKFELTVDSDHYFIAKFEELLDLVGIEWNTTTITSGLALGGIAHGNGKFIAIPYTNTSTTMSRYIYTSEDGKTWTRLSMEKSIPAFSIAFGDGLFVIVCFTDSRHRYSSDGVTWKSTYITPLTKYGVFRVYYGNGKFVATGYNTTVSAISTDPTMPWVEGPTFPYEATWNNIAFDDDHNRAIAFDNYGSHTNSSIAYIDATLSDWQAIELPLEVRLMCANYCKDRFILMYTTSSNAASDQFFFSFDGKTWEIGNLPVASRWQWVGFGNGKFVAIGNLGAALWSKDGIAWEQTTFPLTTVSGAVHANDRFVAVTSNTSQKGVIAYSAPEDTEYN